ncbi:MAG: RIP metalloprotease RseP [Armatimonadetes bacterium]|nr:RIP metalloprotease RseP [Armatimonadota bacterium]
MTIALFLSYIQTAIAFVFIFAVLVLFHELGHYISARLTGMRVDEFAFGFGPRIVRLFKRGDTEYTVRAFPLGGFVKIAGMEPGEENIADGFQAQAIWKRVLVIFCGPLASSVLAILVFLVLGLFWGYPSPNDTTNRVATVEPQTEAARIGLRAGDQILKINNVRISTGKQMTDIIHNSTGKPINLIIIKNGATLKKTATPKWMVEYLGALWRFMESDQGVLYKIAEESPAAKAGLKADDQLLRINGKLIRSGADMTYAIKTAGLLPVHIEVKRNNKIVLAKATPYINWVQVKGVRWFFSEGYAGIIDTKDNAIKYADIIKSVNGKTIANGTQLVEAIGTNSRLSMVIEREAQQVTIDLLLSKSDLKEVKSGLFASMGILGFQPETKLVKVGAGEAIKTAMNIPVDMLKMIGKIRLNKDIGGPLLIGVMTHSSVERGPYWVFWMLGSLSMSLAFINLLPIPIVDGGHLVLLVVEAIRRKRLTAEQMQVFQMIGLVILIGIFILVMWSDVFKISQGLVPQ